MPKARKCVGIHVNGWTVRVGDVAKLDRTDKIKVVRFIREGREAVVLHNNALAIANVNRITSLYDQAR